MIQQTNLLKEPVGRIFTPAECVQVVKMLNRLQIVESVDIKPNVTTQGTSLKIANGSGTGSGSGSGSSIARWG